VIAFQNINEVLDETEAKAWQKLLGVLTHELMNSIAPISSLAGTLKSRLSALERTAPYTAIFETWKWELKQYRGEVRAY
jgi:two-component system nitrogen regulation sensor histidine kinase NtrY